VSEKNNPIDRERFDAVLFDLDGVLTATAKVHAVAWKKTFDEFLRHRSEQRGEPFVPFEIDPDYKVYVDGKPRSDGIISFLGSRGIELPQGEATDAPNTESVYGLGNHKSDLVLAVLESDGVEAYEGSVAMVKLLRREGFKTGVVSSSNNCREVLQAAGIEDLFDVRVDGVVAKDLDLPGKPAPDTFLEAARELGVEPGRTVVVEDAIAGVQAGRAGGFALVIGVDRHDEATALGDNGADIVVSDVGELLP
jgi:beta-phosphoglucomutase family hydrolase